MKTINIVILMMLYDVYNATENVTNEVDSELEELEIDRISNDVVCEDIASRTECSSNTRRGFCEKRPYWMEINCGKTCGFCGPCQDLRYYCKRWKASCAKGRRFYKLIIHVCRETCGVCANGKWSEWEPWASCSVTCGAGHTRRHRLCDSPAPSNRGTLCEVTDKSRRDSSEVQTKSCDAGPCAVDGNWGEWNNWSACSVTCGSGHVTRERLCNNPSPKKGGKVCDVTDKSRRDSSEIERKSCDTGACPSPCEDLQGTARCTRWKGRGFCPRVKKRCKKTCDACDLCEDKQGTRKCESWMGRGMCPRVKHRCMKTCGECKKTGTPKPTSPPVTKTYPPIVQPSCGKDTMVATKRDMSSIVKKIVGGDEAKEHVWIWQGMIFNKGIFHCGGTLITPQLFLTAAHCLHDSAGKLFDKEDMEIRMGYHNRKANESSGQIRTISVMTNHESFRSGTLHQPTIHDIALVKVNSPFVLNKKVGCACLPPADADLPVNETCYITGWGGTQPGGHYRPKHLQQAKMFVKSHADCLPHDSLKKTQFCGDGGDGVISACQGDSGGPLVCKSKENKWVIQGVVSFGEEKCRAKKGLTVFSRVSTYVLWIRKHAS